MAIDRLWEKGLDDLIARAERAADDACEEVAYIEKLEKFVQVGREFRETFRQFITRGMASQGQSLPMDYEQDPHTQTIARQYAPATGGESLRRVANGSYSGNGVGH